MRARAILVGVVVGVLALSPVAEGRIAVTQKEAGTVFLPTPHPQDPATCFQGIARRLNMVTEGQAGTGGVGPFGGVFDVNKKTWRGKFVLKATGQADADMDLYFFTDFGPGIPDDPSMNGPIIIGQFQKRAAGGEKGVVPKGATKAITCLYTGVLADWSYTAKK